MYTHCPKCGKLYDDYYRWTICPHNCLEAGPATPRYNCGKPGYCAGHDLFNCTFEPPEERKEETDEVPIVPLD